MYIAYIFIADEITIANGKTKSSLSKHASQKFRRHSSQQQSAYPHTAVLKIGEATALPVMLYQHWMHVQQPSAPDDDDDDDDKPIQVFNVSDAHNFPNDTQYAAAAAAAATTSSNAQNDPSSSSAWTTKKMSTEDAITR